MRISLDGNALFTAFENFVSDQWNGTTSKAVARIGEGEHLIVATTDDKVGPLWRRPSNKSANDPTPTTPNSEPCALRTFAGALLIAKAGATQELVDALDNEQLANFAHVLLGNAPEHDAEVKAAMEHTKRPPSPTVSRRSSPRRAPTMRRLRRRRSPPSRAT